MKPEAKPVQKSSFLKNLQNMAFGGTAGTIGIMCVYPMESVKTIIQLKSEAKEPTSIAKVFRETKKSPGGLSNLFKGLPAALMRQFFFASIRLGLFYTYADFLKAKQKKDALTLTESTLGSLTTAAIGISAVMPFDVIFVRCQADNALPLDQRRGYKGLGDALSKIIKTEGAATLWRGILPAMGRAMALNFGMLVPYDKCKVLLAPYFGYTRKNYLLSAAIAGFGSSFCSLPFDNAKVKLQKMKKGADGKMPYKGVLDCFVKCIKNEGVTRLWAGFIVFYSVIGPHSMLCLLISDALRLICGVASK